MLDHKTEHELRKIDRRKVYNALQYLVYEDAKLVEQPIEVIDNARQDDILAALDKMSIEETAWLIAEIAERFEMLRRDYHTLEDRNDKLERRISKAQDVLQGDE